MNDYTTSAGGWGGGEGAAGHGRGMSSCRSAGFRAGANSGFWSAAKTGVQGAAALVRGSTRVLVSARAARPGLTAAARDDDGLSPRYRPCHRQERGLECWNEWL